MVVVKEEKTKQNNHENTLEACQLCTRPCMETQSQLLLVYLQVTDTDFSLKEFTNQ